MSASKYQVLLIEDNPMNMELVTDLLETSGMQVWQARTAEEGLCQARGLPNLILMDLSLPGMDGLTAIRMLRSNPAINHLPVIALTAHAMKGDDTVAIGAGFDGYLTKPIDTRTFVKTVMALVEVPPRQRTLTNTAIQVRERFNLNRQQTSH